MTETEYWRNCQDLWGEIEEAIAVFYTLEEITSLTAKDEAILECVQADALFWKVQVYTLQTTLFIVLGRIFDINDDAYSIHKLLRDTVRHVEFFSKDALRARKEQLDLTPEVLEGYFADVWIPDRPALKELKRALVPHAKRFTEVYLPLRHKFFAHNFVNDERAIADLFANTNRRELEETLLFVRDLIGLIQDLYVNGREPKLGQMTHERYREEITSSVRSVLGKVLRAHGGAVTA